jgi:hypothetical protein
MGWKQSKMPLFLAIHHIPKAGIVLEQIIGKF